MHITKYDPKIEYLFPVSGLGAAIASGAALRRGAVASASTENGMLLPAGTGVSSNVPDLVGVIKEAHATADDTVLAGTKYTTKLVELFNPVRVTRIKFDLTSLITCTQAVSTTAMTVTSLEDNIDAAFLYVVSGTGAGQTNFLTASAAGSCTLKAAFGTSLDTSSKFIKILRRFHDVVSLNSDGTKLASQAAAGQMEAMIFNIYIERNSRLDSLDPTKHDALTGLNGIPQLQFYADVCFRNTFVYTID